jgi:hypothetical protein
MGSTYTVNPDCSTMGDAHITITKKPINGDVDFQKTEVFPAFKQDNVRFACDTKKVPAVEYFYTSRPDFAGSDSFTIEVLYPNGELRTIRINVTVRSGG